MQCEAAISNVIAQRRLHLPNDLLAVFVSFSFDLDICSDETHPETGAEVCFVLETFSERKVS